MSDISNYQQSYQQQIQGIIQCKECLNFITTTSKIEQIYAIDGVLFIQLQVNIPSIIKSDKRFVSGDQTADDQQVVSELCVYEQLICKNCKVEAGRQYIATTEAYDQIRMKSLLLETSILCQDAESCEIVEISSLFPNAILVQSNRKESTHQSASSSRKQSIQLLSRDSGNKQILLQRGNLSSQNNIKKEEQNSNSAKIQQSIQEINTSVKSFDDSLYNFDERIGNSEVQIEYLNSKVIELFRIAQDIKNQRNQSNQSNHSNQQTNSRYLQDVNSTPILSRNYFEAFPYSRSKQNNNPQYGYKMENFD